MVIRDNKVLFPLPKTVFLWFKYIINIYNYRNLHHSQLFSLLVIRSESILYLSLKADASMSYKIDDS